MVKQKNAIANNNNILGEASPAYGNAEIALLRDALNRSYKERFLMATRLYKVQQTMQKATITHQPFIKK